MGQISPHMRYGGLLPINLAKGDVRIMKIFEYNAKGDIRSVALPVILKSKDEVRVNLRLLPAPGYFVAEVEAEHIHDDKDLDCCRHVCCKILWLLYNIKAKMYTANTLQCMQDARNS
jgi:hypothetical protein